MLRSVIQTMDFGRIFAHITFTTMFVYDIMWNGNDFGWDNAGLYGAATFGGEAILTLAKLRYGAGNGVDSSKLEDAGNGGDSSAYPDSRPAKHILPRQSPKAGKRKQRPF